MNEIESIMHTSTLKPAEEKKLIKDLEFLKKSISYVKRLDEIKPKRDEAYDKQKSAGE